MLSWLHWVYLILGVGWRRDKLRSKIPQFEGLHYRSDIRITLHRIAYNIRTNFKDSNKTEALKHHVTWSCSHSSVQWGEGFNPSFSDSKAMFCFTTFYGLWTSREAMMDSFGGCNHRSHRRQLFELSDQRSAAGGAHQLQLSAVCAGVKVVNGLIHAAREFNSVQPHVPPCNSG